MQKFFSALWGLGLFAVPVMASAQTCTDFNAVAAVGSQPMYEYVNYISAIDQQIDMQRVARGCSPVMPDTTTPSYMENTAEFVYRMCQGDPNQSLASIAEAIYGIETGISQVGYGSGSCPAG